jgi:N-hydroxyarylamine O-acetyltransferase
MMQGRIRPCSDLLRPGLMSTDLDLPAYLRRIAWTGATPTQPDLPTLHGVQRAHALAIAFENIDPWLGRDVALDLTSLQAKLVAGGRGGYCYEHNLLLGAVLRRIGFDVTDLAARVAWNLPPGMSERPRTHMLLKVRAAGADWLVDAGFGGLTLTTPLRLGAGAEQVTPQGRFRLAADQQQPGLAHLEVAWQGRWQALYAYSSWYLCHHPASAFRSTLVVARPRADGTRWTLRDRRLTRYQPDGTAEAREIDTPAALRAALQEIFGLRLDHLPELDERLVALCAAPLP